MRILSDNHNSINFKDTFYHLLNPKLKKKKAGQIYREYSISQKLINLSKDHHLSSISFLFTFLENNIYKILTDKPSQLLSFNNDLEKEWLKYFSNTDLLYGKSISDILSEVFDYDSFRNGNGKGSRNIVWFNLLNLKTCPYCNRNWMTFAKDESGKFKLYFDIDHYFPKHKYPWFALSFYNLIPSCTICNQRLKGAKELNLNEYLHPYIDDLDNIIKFNVPVKSLDVFFDPTTKLTLEVIARKTGDPDFIRAKRYFDFFNLQNLYDTHLDYVRELIQKDIIYSPTYIDRLYKDYSNENRIFDSKEDLMKMLFGNYVLSEQIHNRPLAKLTKDLLEDFSLNKTI